VREVKSIRKFAYSVDGGHACVKGRRSELKDRAGEVQYGGFSGEVRPKRRHLHPKISRARTTVAHSAHLAFSNFCQVFLENQLSKHEPRVFVCRAVSHSQAIESLDIHSSNWVSLDANL
jgi:hypothetical protein